MNIFVTNTCPVQSAIDHNDVHLRKMLTEVVQLLSTAHQVLDGFSPAMKATHQNHPSAVWVMGSTGQYLWAWKHAAALSDEYTFRTGKVHASSRWLEVLQAPPSNTPAGGVGAFAMAMPEEYKRLGVFDQTKSYKAYLNDKFKNWTTRTNKKQMPVAWTGRDKPDWVNF